MDPLMLLLWGVIAGAIGFQIGQLRGRPRAGLVWGLFLGPLGWLIVLVGPDLRSKCRECGGVVVPGSRRCKNCGTRLKSRDTVPVPSRATDATPGEVLFTIDFEGEPSDLRPIVVLACPVCRAETRSTLPSEPKELHRLACRCGFTLAVSGDELVAETLRAGADLGERLLDAES